MDYKTLFDKALERIMDGDFIGGFQHLGKPLSAIYVAHEAAGTANQMIADARAHPLFELLQQDPYTSRAFNKPRGYAGDAVMMDYVYHGTATSEISAIGRGILQATTRTSMGLSVIYRKMLLNAYINDAVSSKYPYRVISIASGHCRELANSLVLDPSFNGTFVALDADQQTCSEVESTYPIERVIVIAAGIKDLLTNKVDIPQDADLIYSAGLFDYLEAPVAKMLVKKMVQKLRPQGKLLVANFVPTSHGRGYMECFMDWHLIYRTEHELRSLFPAANQEAVTVTIDPHANVAYAAYENTYC